MSIVYVSIPITNYVPASVYVSYQIFDKDGKTINVVSSSDQNSKLPLLKAADCSCSWKGRFTCKEESQSSTYVELPCVPTGDRGGEYKIATTIYFSLKSGYAQESFYSIQAGSLIYQGMRINLIFKDQVKISCYNIILILSLILLVISIVILTVGIRKKINAMKIIGIILCVISILGLGISITRDDPSN